MTRPISRKKREAMRNAVADPDTRKAFLQLRWARLEDGPHSPYQWICHYELVIPLRRWDTRREENTVVVKNELIVKLGGPTKRGSDNEPCRVSTTGELYFDVPLRDGAHAGWDAALLGGLDVFVIALDGTVIPEPVKDRLP